MTCRLPDSPLKSKHRRWRWLALRLAISVWVGLWLGTAQAQDAPAPPPAADPALDPARLAAQAESQASLADGLYRRQLFEMASREYETLIRDYPAYASIPDAHLLLAECYRRMNEPARAEQMYRDVLVKFPDNPARERALVNLFELFSTGKRGLDVLEMLPAVGLDRMSAPTQEAVHYYVGTLYRQQEKLPEAMVEFARLPRDAFSADFPFRPYAQLTAGLIHRSLREDALAEPLLKSLAEATNVPDSVRQEALLHLGELAFAASDFELTVARYRELIARYPDTPYLNQARLGIGWGCLELKQYREILKLFEGSEDAPANATADAFFLRGSAQKELKMYEAALDTFRQLVQRFADSHFRPYAEVAVIECLYFLKRYPECVQQCDLLLQAEKPHQFTLEISQFLGQSYLELRDYARVASTFENLLQNHWDKVAEQRRLILLLADAYERIQRYEDAARTYRRLLDLKDTPEREQALILAAENEMKAKRYDQALADYERLVRDFSTSPYVPRALVGMAEARVQLGQPEQAIELLNRLLSTFPETEYRNNALYLRGSLHFRLGHTKEAIVDLAASLKEPTFPERDYARLFLAYALWDAGRESEALQLFIELLQIESMEKNFTPKMLKEIGEKYLERNNIAAAERAFSLLANGADLEARQDGVIGLGKTEFLKGRYEEANQLFEKVRKLASTESEQYVIALAYLGETYRLLGKPDRALLAFQDGIRLGTKDPDANALLRVGIARIYHAEKRYPEALSKANAAYILFGDTKYAPEGALLSCRILVDQNKIDEARIVYKEMESRYPIALASFKQDARNAELFKKLE